MVEWLAGNRIRGTSAERTNTTGIGNAVGGWKELARHTRTTQGIMDVSSIPLSRYYMVLTNVFDSAPAGNMRVYCNNDTGSTHADRGSQNGAGDFTEVSKTNGCYWGGNTIDEGFGVTYWSNLAGKEKLGISHFVDRSALGAGTAPDRSEAVLKWSDVSTAINRFNSPASWNFWDSGSEMIVLGWDPADTHSTNFWEELYSGSGLTGMDTGVAGFTAKKYLWIQAYVTNLTTGNQIQTIFNGDTTAKYSLRNNRNGTVNGDATLIDRTDGINYWSVGGSAGENEAFLNMFIINNSANEKLGIAHWNVATTAGAGYAPIRQESVIKWANTSAQITDLQVLGSTFGSSSELRIWGHD